MTTIMKTDALYFGVDFQSADLSAVRNRIYNDYAKTYPNAELLRMDNQAYVETAINIANKQKIALCNALMAQALAEGCTVINFVVHSAHTYALDSKLQKMMTFVQEQKPDVTVYVLNERNERKKISM